MQLGCHEIWNPCADLGLTPSVVFILLLIARSKLVLDFAVTIHFIHLVITSLYTRAIPTYYFWWALQIASTALMVFLGMWSCQWRELRPVYFGGKDVGLESQTIGGPGDAESAHGGIAFDPSRGRSRTRRGDGAGDYEMVSAHDGQPS